MSGAMDTVPVRKWQTSIGEGYYGIAADINGDGRTEVVFGSENHWVYAMDGATGSVLWSHEVRYRAGLNPPAAADVDGDGNVEVLIVDQYPAIYCIDGGSGSRKWDYIFRSFYSGSYATFGDLSGDQNLEVVASNLYTDEWPNGDDTAALYVFGGAGNLLWRAYNACFGNTYLGWPALADVDGDGKDEVFVGLRSGDESWGSNDTAYAICYDGQTGQTLWRTRLVAASAAARICRATLVEDLEGDGQMEALYLVEDGSEDWVFCLDANTGGIKWRSRLSDDPACDLVAYDANGDGVKEVYTGDVSGKIYCFNGSDGSLLWSRTILNAPKGFSLCDIDGDGHVELIYGAGCGSLGQGERGWAPSLRLRPTSTGVSLWLPKGARVRLRLFAADGRLVRVLFDGSLSPGEHSFPIGRKGLNLVVAEAEGVGKASCKALIP